ncbi:MAG: hypothetical protein KGD63_09195 [Candidatus Lokiarchaeota archaeon]|nr:hypothetical protein [Candidatus Lokiarchaeota archaeon]
MKNKNKVSTKILIVLIFGSLTSLGIFLNPSFASPGQVLKTAAPKNILIYTEYTDDSNGGELENTIDAINQSYGNFTYGFLTDYTNLTAQLSGYDILLIPEQENGDVNTFKTIGLNWTDPLKSFINGGGTVIILDYSGGSYHIYNSSGLMLIMGELECTGENTTLINQNSPLANNVNGNFTLSDGSIYFETNETTSVVEYDSNPVVIHKRRGKGHMVLMGIDFYEIVNETATILGNAVALNPGSGIPGYDLNVFIGLSIFSIGITLIILKKKFKIKK